MNRKTNSPYGNSGQSKILRQSHLRSEATTGQGGVATGPLPVASTLVVAAALSRRAGVRAVLVAACLGLVCLATPAWAKARTAKIFGDNMVLQRDQPVPVWGWTDPGDEVTVSFAGQTKTVRADTNGAWRVTLKRMPASSEPRTMVITSKAGDPETRIEGILVGEVWFCSGQSNMGLALRDCFGAPEEIAAANYPQFRFFVVPGGGAPVPATDLGGGQWQVCTPQTAADFAGTAYFFGRALHRELKVPVGLIEFDRGATGIEGWVPLVGYKDSTVPALQAMYREAASWDPRCDIGRQAHDKAFADIAAWIPLAKAAILNGKPVPPEPLLPVPSRQVPGPTTTYNGIIHPLVPYAIRGAAWYHGEANPGEGEIYEQKLEAMITGWRTAWDQGDFPFYLVQLANEGNTVIQPMEEETFRYVPVREAQRRALDLPRTGMAVAIDLGEDASGHPRNKKDVGERLALCALADTYKHKVPFSGPLYRSSRIKGDTVVLQFDHVGGGLMIGDKDGLQPVHEVTNGVTRLFSIAGADGVWHWADARITGKTVEVRSDKVPVPVRVRYAYSMNPKGNKLYNREGLPASPFRTDDW